MSPRNFAILALATVASIALAAHAVSQRDTPLRVEAAGEAMFPGLLDRLNDVHEIRITMPAGKLTVTADGPGLVPGGEGGLPDRSGEGARPGAGARQPAAGRGQDRRSEAPGASGAGASPALMAPLPGWSSCSAAMARRWRRPWSARRARPSTVAAEVASTCAGPRDHQAWLAGGELDLPADAMTLIGSELVDVPLDQVARVVVQPPGGVAATLSRPDVLGRLRHRRNPAGGPQARPGEGRIARRRPGRADHGRCSTGVGAHGPAGCAPRPLRDLRRRCGRCHPDRPGRGRRRPSTG